MQSLFTVGVTCQVEGLLKSLRVGDNPPTLLINSVQAELSYPAKINRSERKILVAKVGKMDKYLQGKSFYTLLNYILAIAEDAGLNTKSLFRLYCHYDPDLNKGVEAGNKLAKKWSSIW